MDYLGKWGETVSRAGGIGNKLEFGLVVFVVYTEHKNWRIIFRRGGENNFLRASIKVSLSFVLRQEDTCAFSDVVRAYLAPRDG